MLAIVKIEGGINWGETTKSYTNSFFETGYEILDTNHISIELDNQIYCLAADSVTVDGKACTDSTDLVSKIFAIK